MRLTDTPHRNWDSVAIGVVIAAMTSILLANILINATGALKDPFWMHLKVILTNWPYYKTQVLPLFPLLAFVESWLFFIIIMIFGQVAAFSFFGRMINPLTHIRGRRWLIGKEAIAEAKRASKRWLQNSKGEIEILKDIWLSMDRLLKSILLVGAQGGGKTQVLNLLLTLALRLGHKALIFDPTKGDYVKWVKNRVLISSTDARTVHPWLGFDITSVEDAQAFSEGLIEASDQAMWSNSARMICTGVIVHLQKSHEKEWSWSQLSETLANQELIQKACQDYPPAAPLVADLESKTTQSILMNLLAYGEMIYTLAQNFGKVKGKRFSIIDFILNDDSKVRRVVFAMNQRSPADAAFARALVNLITRRIGSLEFTESKKRRVGLWLDEIAQFGPLENLSKTMEVGRSKGIYVVAATQDFSQISKIYGQDELQKWDALFGLKIFMEIAGQESQDFVSKTVGQREVQIIQRNTSGNGSGTGNVNINTGLGAPQKRDVILPSEMATFGKRANGIESLWVGYSPNYALSLTTPFVNPPEAYKPFVSWSAEPVKVLAKPTAREVELQPSTQRAASDNSSLEIGKAKLAHEQAKTELKSEKPTLQSKLLNILETQPDVLDEYIKPAELEDAADGLIVEAVGLDHLKEGLEVIDMLLPKSLSANPIIQTLNQIQGEELGLSKRNQRKPRKYVYEN